MALLSLTKPRRRSEAWFSSVQGLKAPRASSSRPAQNCSELLPVRVASLQASEQLKLSRAAIGTTWTVTKQCVRLSDKRGLYPPSMRGLRRKLTEHEGDAPRVCGSVIGSFRCCCPLVSGDKTTAPPPGRRGGDVHSTPDDNQSPST